MQEQIACDLCGRVDAQTFVMLPSEHTFGIVQCQHCGLVYLDPRPSPDEIAQYYTSDYYTSLPPRRPSNISLSTQIRRLAYKARCQCLSEETRPSERFFLSLARLTLGWRVRRRVPMRRQGRLLDVGCGNGQWLAWIRDSVPRWEVEGVEINSFAAAQARATGHLIVHVGHLESLGLPAAQYDMISFWHSLEHVSSPTATLQEVHRLLRPGGWVGIEVPNIGSWEARQAGGAWYHLDIPKHLYHFSTPTLIQILFKCGFHIMSTEPVRGHVSLTQAVRDGVLRSPYIPYFLAHLSSMTLGRLSPWGIRVYAVKS